MGDRGVRFFRGKLIDNSGWAVGYHVALLSDDNLKHYIIPKDAVSFGAVEVISETVGQCIGVKDNKGTLAYEGDIIKYDNPEYGYGDDISGYLYDVLEGVEDLADEDIMFHLLGGTIIGNSYDFPGYAKRGDASYHENNKVQG